MLENHSTHILIFSVHTMDEIIFQGVVKVGEIGWIIIKTLFYYLLIIVIFRLMGKREIGELSIVDLVVYIMLAELAIINIENPDSNIIQNIIPIIVLTLVQIIFSYLSLKSKRFRDVIEGKPSIIISQGKIDEKEMRRQRYNFDDLLMQLRLNNVRHISEVEYAILETSGKLSVIKKDDEKNDITIPLIIDGEIQEKNLHRINKNIDWLKKELEKEGYTNMGEISFCSYENGKLFVDCIDHSWNE